MRRRIAAGNWKMNGLARDLETVGQIARAAAGSEAEALLCLPATLLHPARHLGLRIGGQDCRAEEKGAYTGDISAAQLRDAGADYVILGHSERRSLHGESDALIAAKARAARAAGLTAIICIGETESQYRAGATLEVLLAQLAGSLPEGADARNTVVAYEPVWAIGTGLTPSLEEIGAVHGALRAKLPDPEIALLYGGSCNPANAAAIFALPDVDGGLIGGASLQAETFLPILRALEASK